MTFILGLILGFALFYLLNKTGIVTTVKDDIKSLEAKVEALKSTKTETE